MVRYVHERGRVLRLSKEGPETSADEMRSALARADAEGDPFYVLEQGEGYSFAPYSLLVPRSSGDDLFRVGAVEPRPLTAALLDAHDLAKSYYAPLMMFHDAHTGAILGLQGAVVLVSDPLALPVLLENWRRADLEFPPFATTILRTYVDVDGAVGETLDDGLGVLIDPRFDARRNLVSGYVVFDLDALVSERQER
ncbi:MAG: hypothetical protein JWQ48_1214 [Conexibacter sp.]|nr:hypothetical protein [Conexibacter sp.]